MSEKKSTNAMYLAFGAYSLVFFLLSRKEAPLEPYLDFVIGMRAFMMLFIAAIAFTAIILIYNAKNDVKSSYKLLGYIFGASNIIMGINWMMTFLGI